MAALDWATLLLLSVIWGGSFFFAKVAVVEVPPLLLVFIRVSVAALVLLAVLAARGGLRRVGPATIGAFLFMGLFNSAVPFTLLFWAQTHIQSGLASILNATTPLFTLLVAHLFTRDEKISGGRLAGIVLGFAGVVTMIGPHLLDQLGTDLLAQLACIGAALSYGITAVFGRRLRGLPPMLTAAGQLSAASLILLPAVLLFTPPWQQAVPSPHVAAATLGLAVVSTAFAYILYFRILGRNGATNISLVTLLVPVSAILLGALVLGERLSTESLAGFGLIALGLAAIDGRPWRRLRGRMRHR
ncbi:DMT family transporter [Ancylobacter sp. 6x-1]|uniref:DMT family transporter n=2 Tax=Ancylobacter crimeensis TaxID=2579147 RepID=A0ABT0DDK8_9HYPH|nr:DMT family transporter [Ancylobacter crimeensis]MCK0197837.1 DMT family transporter [Ancylobacter crimeensis]